MSKITKKIYSAVMLCLMISVFFVIPVKADGEGAISGKIRINSTYYPMGTPASGDGWDYDGERILTLDEFDGDVVCFYPDADIYDEQILKVKLLGENKTNYLSIGNEYYDCYRIHVIGDGSIDIATGIPKYMDIKSGTVTIYNAGARYVSVESAGVLNFHTTFEGTDLLGISMRARISGGTLNVFTSGRYLTWPWKDSLRLVNGGTVNVSSCGDKWYGGIMANSDSHFWSAYTITDFAGNPTVCYEKRKEAWMVASPSDTEMPLSNIRVVGGEVDIAAEKVTLNYENPQVKVGKQLQLVAAIEPANSTETITWTSWDPSVATIDENGYITGINIGYTCIEGVLTNGKTIMCYVSVVPDLMEISCNLSATKLTYTGKNLTPKVTVKDENGNVLKEGTHYTLSYSSSVRKKAGRYTITVIPADGYSGGGDFAYQIAPQKVSNFKISKTEYSYDGKVKTPSVTVKNKNGTVLKADNDYTVTYSKGRKNVGKYTVKVKMKGNYSGEKTLSFTILPGKTSVKSVTPGKKQLTVKWAKKTTQVTGYEVQCSTSSKFTKAATKSYTIKSNKTTSKKITNLKAGKKYYVKVRTYKTVKVDGKNVKLYSGWSAVKTVKTK